MNDEEQTPCVPAVMTKAQGGKQVGDWCCKGYGKKRAREELIRREGPPSSGMKNPVCRHTCKNDSQAPNGFVCILHTTWGTHSENMQDKSPEDRKRGGRLGGRIVGPIVCARPDNANKLQVTCSHCGMTGAKWPMARWHFDNCRYKP
jgi:hypothetical protein